jgi:hypothetical protein
MLECAHLADLNCERVLLTFAIRVHAGDAVPRLTRLPRSASRGKAGPFIVVVNADSPAPIVHEHLVVIAVSRHRAVLVHAGDTVPKLARLPRSASWRFALERIIVAVGLHRTVRIHAGDPVARVTRFPRSASWRFAFLVVWVIVAIERHRAVRILAGDTVSRLAR